MSFASRVVEWHRRHGRHDLPWQNTRDPYRIWLSEVMLQQTQVTTVLAYYERFLCAFPDVAALAVAPLDDVLRVWSGLGYYRRARHLHEAAKIVMRDHGGAFPRELDRVASLPGIGRSTASAIAAFAFGTCAAILDGNVKRVLARHRAIEGHPATPAVERALWTIAESELPATDIEAYTQAIMDLGATVCMRTRPRCDACPVARDCEALRTHRVGALPTPRPARVLPQRATHVLMLEWNGAWLFEQRPSVGIWADLWSLPEIACGEDPLTVCRVRYGVEPGSVDALPAIEHAFTHYRLTLRPLRIALSSQPLHMTAPGRTWLTIDAALSSALPAPIKRLVQIHCAPAELFA